MASSKDVPFRLCIALLLAIQAVIWALMLLDLLSPGRPLSLYRVSMDTLGRLVARRSEGLLSYKSVRVRF
jgi:hypothetical protein